MMFLSCDLYSEVKILCHLHHDQLRAVFHVSQRIRMAVSDYLSLLSLINHAGKYKFTTSVKSLF